MDSDYVTEDEQHSQSSSSFATLNTSQVIVCHVENPEKFYCRFAANSSKLDEMYDTLIWPKVSSPFSSTPDISDCKPNDNVLAFSPINKNWCRATIVTVTANNVKVYLIDYGSEEIISWNHVRQTDDSIISYNNRQSFCFECSLYCIKPYTCTPQWSSYAQYLMEKLTKGRIVTMHYNQFNDGVIVCDVSCDAGKSGGFHSMIDYLVHSNVALYKMGERLYHRTKPTDDTVDDDYDDDSYDIQYNSNINSLCY